ncbi:MAG: DNA-processing protein DprA [Deltaproteobacteria bacterium]|nr:DNA-processing protein DprA [Deltaproteobacteria bacterium]
MLYLIPGLGNIAFKNLLDRMGSPEAILKASLDELKDVEGVREEIALHIKQQRTEIDPSAELKKIKDMGVHIITYTDVDYPPLLRAIHDPPMLLYAKGLNIPTNHTFVSVVGSRNPTPYGLKTAEILSQGLARRSLGVVSGMARGIDSKAHWGCLSGKGFTIAVLGTGIDRIYPASNEKLFREITQKGLVLSEFPLGTPPKPNHFPVRNRIISGISKAVVVVEATKNSGSLITAGQALEQGREVFAVPGSIHSFKSAGCHFLIKQGARLVENADDILEELGLNYPFLQKTDSFFKDTISPVNEAEKIIYDLIGDYPIHIDQIAHQGNLETHEVSSILTRMELKGMIRQLPGKMFVR